MPTPLHPELIATLPPVHRLALAYAPATTAQAWLGLLALDARLAGVVRSAREPVLGQLRLAWWRERLADQGAPRGEPLLGLLMPWGDHRAGLISLVDGWEAMLGEAPLDEAALAALAGGRAEAVASLALVSGAATPPDAAHRLATGWALGDLATNLTHPDELSAARALCLAHDWRVERLPRGLRPLVVLHGLARRGQGHAGGIVALLAGMRLGIFGR